MKTLTKTGWIRFLAEIPLLEIPRDQLEPYQPQYRAAMVDQTLVVDFYGQWVEGVHARAFLHPRYGWMSQNNQGKTTAASLQHALARSTASQCWLFFDSSPHMPGDAEVINRYFSGEKGLREIFDHQDRVMRQRLAKKHAAICQRIDEKMDTVGDLPDGFNRWVSEEVLKPYRYIYYDYTGKRVQTGRCTHCNETVQLTGMRYNEQGTCPMCNSRVQFKSRRKAPPMIHHRLCGVFVRTTDGKWAHRIFDAVRSVKKYGGVEDRITEIRRDFYDADLTDIETYEYATFRQTGNIRWCEPSKGNSYTSAYLYLHNLDEVLRDRPYTGLKEFALAAKSPVCTKDYLAIAEITPQLEYLVKAGLYTLVSGIHHYYSELDVTKNDLPGVLRLTKEHARWARTHDLDRGDLLFLRAIEKDQVPLKEDDFLLLKKKDLAHTGYATILCLKFARAEKLLNYLENQLSCYSIERKLEVFHDNVRMMQQMGHPINKSTIYPKNLMQTHDTLVKLFKIREDELLKTRLKRRGETLNNQYAMTFGDYLIVAPQSTEELTQEGQTLRHCVASYAKRISEGETTVLFIRRRSSPQQPFATMEIRDNRITQVRGSCNKDLTKTLSKFLKEFKKQKEVA